MNVKVDVNLSKIGRLVQSSKDGHYYLDVTDLIERYGYVSQRTGDSHFTMTAYERNEIGKYGDTHSIRLYDKTTKIKTYCNDISIKKYDPENSPEAGAMVQKNGSLYPEDIF